jgi:hypothetical protein
LSSPTCATSRREGIPILGAGEKIRCVWDHIDRLEPYLIEKGLRDGITAKVAYKDLAGETYTTEWRINPLLYKGLRYDIGQPSQGLSDLCSENEKGGKQAKRREAPATETGVVASSRAAKLQFGSKA